MSQSKLTFEQIINQLQFLGVEIEDFALEDVRKECTLGEHLVFMDWQEVCQYGGEGQGDMWYSVKYFPYHDVYIRVDGYYSSYEGVDFEDWADSCKEVKPKEKTITVYE